ncbi:MAG: NAD-dependent epimerase/dehydratase family protein [Propionibacteriaceae bacterium]|nr:NAD-dependent epimerase/dehydratase family protein [Propionibacteriaceae bacterium]
MKVLVAGGSGFVGSRLVPLLVERGHEVRVYDLVVNPELSDITVRGDVREVEPYLAAALDCDAIINLAAAHRDNVRPVELYHTTNVDGARVTTEVAERVGIQRIVFTSSVSVYGLNKPPSRESDPTAPFNAYSKSKLAAEQVYRAWYDAAAGRTLQIVRPSVIFGERNRGNVYTLAKQIKSGRFLTVGDGKNRKSMAYVGNVVEFLASLLEDGNGYRLLNYADKPDMSTNELVATIRGALGRDPKMTLRLPLWLGILGGRCFDLLAKLLRRELPISSIRIEKFAAETVVDTTALEATGFARTFTLAEGLRRTVAAEFPA